jgi:16S rRNA processing protein RimM
MSIDTEYIIVGKIGAPYGIKGWLKITSYTESIPDILDYGPWYLEDNQSWKLIEVEDGRTHGKGIVAKIKGFNTPEAARILTGKTIAINRSQLPKLNQQEYYWSDLKGLTVINQQNEVLGVVIYLIATGSNDVLVIKGEKEKEFAIPYLPEVVTRIDLAEKVMHVNWDLI